MAHLFWGLFSHLSHVQCRLQDKGVGKDAEWGSLLEKAPLRHADDVDSATLSHAVDIFVERHHLLWKVQSLLLRLSVPISTCQLAVGLNFLNKRGIFSLNALIVDRPGSPVISVCAHQFRSIGHWFLLL